MYIHTCYVLINPPMPIHYVLICIYVYNCRAMVDMLIERGGRKLMLLQDAAGDTSLHLAARADQPSAIEVCVR